MNTKTKDGYLVAGIFVFVGLLFLYISWWDFDLSFYIGIGLTLLGGAGFKWPEVAEVLVHWAKKQEKANNNYSKQNQRNTKNSNQVSTNSGEVHIHQYNK